MAAAKTSSVEGVKLTKVSIVCNQSKFEALKKVLNEIGVMGITVAHVLGCGIQKGRPKLYRGVEVEVKLLLKVKVEVIVSSVPMEKVIETARRVLYTGNIGDGKIFLYNVEDVVKVRTGESGFDALQGEEDSILSLDLYIEQKREAEEISLVSLFYIYNLKFKIYKRYFILKKSIRYISIQEKYALQAAKTTL